MSRPRKPDDPEEFPDPCSRCGEHRYVAATWPDGPICGYCYQKAKRTRGVCDCGHVGVLPGIIQSRPACRACSGVKLNVDCKVCGSEDELYSGSRCWSCMLGAVVDRSLARAETGRVPDELVPIATALKSMKRANSGLTWIQQPHVQRFLAGLSNSETITHEAIDALPVSKTREFVRDLMVEHGSLPRRDTYLFRFKDWSDQALERLPDRSAKDVMARYIRWKHLRHMRGMNGVTNGAFLRAKQYVTVAIDLILWLHERGVPLEEVDQTQLDYWISTGTSTRRLAAGFVAWAGRARIVDTRLKIAEHSRGGSAKMDAEAQDEALEKVVHTHEVPPRERAAAILVLVFGQQLKDVVALTWDSVNITEDRVSITLGGFAIDLPEPLGEPWRQLQLDPGNDNTAAHPNSNWVFPGRLPGRHLNASYFRDWMKQYFSVRSARLGTLHELSKLEASVIIAEALGYSPATIERHALDASANYARHIAELREHRQALVDEASEH